MTDTQATPADSTASEATATDPNGALAWARAVSASLDDQNKRLIAEVKMLRSALGAQGGLPHPAASVDAPEGGEDRMYIYLNSNTKMTRGKAAAHAVHAALTAAGVHHGGPVIVLGASPNKIEKMRVAIHDAGHTEIEPGTLTAGSDWTPGRRYELPADRSPAIVDVRHQYRAVWPGGSTSMWLPAAIPLIEAAAARGVDIDIERREAHYTAPIKLEN